MKCLLIDSHWQEAAVGPRLGLGCLAGAITDLVEIETAEFLLGKEELDAVERSPSHFWWLEQKFLHTISEKLESNPGIRLVGVTGWSGSFPRMLRIAHRCKSVRPEVHLVFGGPHVTLYERHFPAYSSIRREYGFVDELVVGEGELQLRRIVEDLLTSSGPPARAPKRWQSGEEGLVPTAAPGRHSGIGCFHAPHWQPFLQSAPDDDRVVFLAEAGRGCPRACTFCDEHDLWGGYRWFEPERVVDQIEDDIEQFDSHSFRFTDSTLTAHPAVEEICREIIRRRIDVSWSAFAHCAEITDSKGALLAEAGCRCLLIGVESGSDAVLEAMSKGSSRARIESAVAVARRHGIQTRGSFIIGYPGETTEQAEATIEFARRLELDACAWHSYQPPFRAMRTEQGGCGPDFVHYELDTPLAVTMQVLSREPSLLRDMHALPRLVTLDPFLEPDPTRWPTQSARLLSLLRKAVDATGEGGAHDLKLLIEEERKRRAAPRSSSGRHQVEQYAVRA